MPTEWVYLRDLQGPYAGEVVPYLPHAAENAIATGYAERVTEEEPVEVGGAVPVDFPAHKELTAAGITELELVPHTLDELEAIPGIGKKKAEAVLEALG